MKYFFFNLVKRFYIDYIYITIKFDKIFFFLI